jgi:hypothetical protein
MAYTTIDNPELFFQTKLHSGTGGGGGSLTFDGSENMQPDWVWSKSRTEALNHTMFDSVRGAGSNKELTSNNNSAEGGADSAGFGYISAFNSDGFTWTAGGTNTENFNKSSQTYTHWNWKAGTSFTNDASSTGIGSVDSTGSINTTAGISIMSWTSTAAAHTIAHGLSAVPAVIIMKGRHESNSWQVYHHKNTSAPETDYLDLSTTDATADYTVWNDTAPTSSVMSLGTWSGLDDGGTMIAYCFAEKQGYSKFGSYTGNGNADGTFVYTGFRVGWLMIKNASTGSTYWTICDSKRDGFNDNNHRLFPNENDAESTSNPWEMYSNGFKMTTTGSYVNSSGDTFIYMAFAESPFVNSNGVPTNAR